MSRRSLFSIAMLAVLCAMSAAHAGRAYVSNEDGHSVSVIDTDKNTVIATVPVGKRPRGLTLSHDESRLFVAVSGLPKCPPTVPDEECAKLERDLKADGVAVVDTRALKLLELFEAGSDPEQFALHPDGRLFVANEDTGMTTVLDSKTGKILGRVKVGDEPEGVGISPDGRWVLVTNESDNSISVIDAQALKEVYHVPVGKRPRDVAFTPDGKWAYVTGEFDASLWRMAVPDGKPVERVIELRQGALPMSVRLDPERNRAYVSTGRGGTIAVIALDGKPRLIREVKVGTRPWGIALSSDGTRLYSANGPSNDVSVLDTESLEVVQRIEVGRSPWGVVLSSK